MSRHPKELPRTSRMYALRGNNKGSRAVKEALTTKGCRPTAKQDGFLKSGKATIQTCAELSRNRRNVVKERLKEERAPESLRTPNH